MRAYVRFGCESAQLLEGEGGVYPNNFARLNYQVMVTRIGDTDHHPQGIVYEPVIRHGYMVRSR